MNHPYSLVLLLTTHEHLGSIAGGIHALSSIGSSAGDNMQDDGRHLRLGYQALQERTCSVRPGLSSYQLNSLG